MNIDSDIISPQKTEYNGCVYSRRAERKKEMFYLTTHSTHFIYGYMVLGGGGDAIDSSAL